MAHSGVEDKPAWQSLPLKLRQVVEMVLGAPIIRAALVWGGYSPTPTFRLMLAGGKRAFFKGIDRTTGEFAREAFTSEVRVYTVLSPLIFGRMPELYTTYLSLPGLAGPPARRSLTEKCGALDTPQKPPGQKLLSPGNICFSDRQLPAT
jgi:hypothetical protein